MCGHCIQFTLKVSTRLVIPKEHKDCPRQLLYLFDIVITTLRYKITCAIYIRSMNKLLILVVLGVWIFQSTNADIKFNDETTQYSFVVAEIFLNASKQR